VLYPILIEIQRRHIVQIQEQIALMKQQSVRFGILASLSSHHIIIIIISHAPIQAESVAFEVHYLKKRMLRPNLDQSDKQVSARNLAHACSPFLLKERKSSLIPKEPICILRIAPSSPPSPFDSSVNPIPASSNSC
jgi:hypothetical protein